MLDDIIVWWIDDEVFDVMPNASNTDRVRAAIGGTETTHDRAVLAVQGPQAKERLATVFPEAAAVGRFRVSPATWQGVAVHRRRHRLHRRGGCRDRRAGPRPRRPVVGDHGAGVTPAGLGAATRCAWRPRSRCTATSWGRGSPAAGRAGLGGRLVEGRRSVVARPFEAERDAGVSRMLMGIATDGRRPARSDCAVFVGDRSVGMVTSGNFSPVLGHGIALAFMPPETEVETPVTVDVRGARIDGRVVPTPFVGKR